MIEGPNGGVVSERIIESNVANAGAELRMTDWCRHSRPELIAGRKVHGAIRITFPHLEKPTHVVMAGEYCTESPIAGGHDRVWIRATQPQFHGISNRYVVDGDDNSGRLDPCALRIRIGAHLSDHRLAAAPLCPQVGACGYETRRSRRVYG